MLDIEDLHERAEADRGRTDWTRRDTTRLTGSFDRRQGREGAMAFERRPTILEAMAAAQMVTLSHQWPRGARQRILSAHPATGRAFA